MFPLKKIFLFLFAFIFSYLIRTRQIYGPLNSVEYVTSHTLITVELLYKNGLQGLHWSPRYTYESEADKGIPNIGGIKDKEGNYYYVSYPPFTFLFPYLVFKAFGIYPSPVSLRLLNIVMHFISSFFVFLILEEVFDKKDKLSFLSSYGGFLFYLLSPGNLFFHTNYFFSDILVQVFFTGAVYFFVRLEKSKKIGLSYIVLMLVFIFLMAYTEWIGYLFGTVLAPSLLGKTDITKRFQIILSVCIIIGAALFITLIQYSSVSGFKNLIDHLSMKYIIRGGYINSSDTNNLTISNPKAYLNILYFYYSYYLFSIFLILGMLFTLVAIKGKRILSRFSGLSKRILILTFFPVFLHYLLFFNFNSLHSFSTLKASFFLSLLFGVLMREISLLTKYGSILLILSIFIFSVYHPYEPEINFNDDSYFRLGQTVKQISQEDELVFVCNDPSGYIPPQLLYYAKRNILYCTDMKSIQNQISKMRIKKRILFYVDRRRNLVSFERT